MKLALLELVQVALDEPAHLASSGGIELLRGRDEPVTQLLVQTNRELGVLTIDRFNLKNDCAASCAARLAGSGLSEAASTTALFPWQDQVAEVN